MSIYTKGGDKGTTNLVHTKNISKSDDRVRLVGAVDELSSNIGLVKCMIADGDVVRVLEKIQRTLIRVMEGIEDPYNREHKIGDDRTELLEEEIDRMEETLPVAGEQALPGSSRLSAQINVTRAVARRAERELAAVSVKFGTDTGTKKYMNRLCDYFYVLAEYADMTENRQKVVKATEVPEKAAVEDRYADGSSMGSGSPEKTGIAKTQESTDKNTGLAGAGSMDQNENSSQMNTAMIQEVLRRMGIQGRITLDSARKLIEKIEQEALRRGKQAVIAVCGPEGNPIAVHVMDGAFLVSFDVAMKKAYTSVAVRMSTMELSGLTQPGQTFYGLGKMSDNIVIFGGGVPLKVGDTIIGGLGISGGTGEEDHSLAEYGLSILNEVL